MKTKDLKEVLADKQPYEIAIIVSGFTGHRTTLLEELTPEETDRLFSIYCPAPASLDEEYNALKEELVKKEWRSKILATAEKAGIKKSGSFQEFNNWMLTYGKFKKQLTAHTIAEMKELHQQLRALMQSDARSARKPMTKAWFTKSDNLIRWN